MLELFYGIALEITVLMTLWLCLGVLQKDDSSPGRLTFAALCAAACVWCVGDLLMNRGLVGEPVADRIRYVGVLLLPGLWAGLAAHATGLPVARRAPWFSAVLVAPQVALYPLMYTRWAPLFTVTVADGPDAHGPLWWVSTAYSYALVTSGCWLLVRWSWSARDVRHWKHRLAVGLAPFIPLLGNAVSIATGLGTHVDITPLLFGVTMLAVRSAIVTGGLFQALPITQYELIEQLPVGLMLVDRSGVVVGVNTAAVARLGMPADAAKGRTLEAVLETAGDVCAELAPIRSHRGEVGQVVLLDASKA